MCLCVVGNLYADKRFLEFPAEIWGSSPNVAVEVILSANFDQHQDSSFLLKRTPTPTHEGVPEEFDHFPQILFLFSIFIPCTAWEWDRLIIGRYSRTW